MRTIPANDYIHLGQLIWFFHRTQGAPVDNVIAAIEEAIGYFNTQPYEHVKKHVVELAHLREWLDKSKLHDKFPDEITAETSQLFSRIAIPLKDIVCSESAKWQTIILNQSAVSAKLRALENKLTFDDQKALLADAIRCLECGAPRAAIVMVWSLTYEYLRRSVFEDKAGRLAAFNSLLKGRKRTRSDYYEPIDDYEHFQDLGERFVIDLLFEAKLISKQSHQTLVNALHRRNHFAHPSTAKASDVSAAGYIDDLIINVFDNPNFVLPAPEPPSPPVGPPSTPPSP